MSEDLKHASDQIRAACDSYLYVCWRLSGYGQEEISSNDIPRGFLQQLDGELEYLSRHEQSIKEARFRLELTRRHASKFAGTPINTLPSEILLRIFSLVLDSPCGFLEPFGWPCYQQRKFFPKSQNSDYIAQVCSRWRAIAMSCPHLWIHIDFPLYQKSLPPLLSRANIHMHRAKNLPLNIHIHDNGNSDSYSNHDQLPLFLSTIAIRMGSLELSIDDAHYNSFQVSILEAILSSCSPEVFNRLVTYSQSLDSPYVYSRFEDSDDEEDNTDENSDSDEFEKNLSLGITKPQMENAFAGLTTLHLNGCYPFWTSSAYRGLVDLRLEPSPNFDIDIPTIHESQLIAVLEASPGLRIFYFRLMIVGQATQATAVQPILLEGLEVVDLSTEGLYCGPRLYDLGNVLRLLGPGSKPLRLTLESGEGGKELLDSISELHKFFARSKVEKLCLRRINNFSEWMLAHTPDVKFLVLEECYYEDIEPLAEDHPDGPDKSSDSLNSSESSCDGLFMLPLLHSCYVCGGEISDTALSILSDLSHTVILVDYYCCVYSVSETSDGGKRYLEDNELSERFPAVICSEPACKMLHRTTVRQRTRPSVPRS